MMKSRLIVLMIALLALSCVLKAEKIDEIKQYFELRDTLSLVNLEMKRALAPNSRSPMLNDAEAEQNLTRLVMFLEDRVKNFAELNTPLKLHYTRNLNSLFNETRYLYANVLVKIRSSRLNQLPEKIVQTPAASESLEAQPRPYFKPIDLRTLLSPALLNKADLKKAGSVWANQMQATESAALALAKAESQARVSPEVSHKTPVVVSPPADLPEPPQEKKPIVAQAVKALPSGGALKPQNQTPAAPMREKQPASPKSDPVVVASVAVDKSTKKQEAKIEVVPPPPEAIISPVASVSAAVIEPQKPEIQDAKTVSVASQTVSKIETAVIPPADQVQIVPQATPSTAVFPVAIASGTALRPLAVMIENHNKARPQSGLINAEIVYEIPVEGGITRFMALFLHTPGILGPVRSCREYFVDRAIEVSALYVHCGGSPMGYAYISKSKINSIDEIKHGKPFFRDNTRKAPHNLYTKGTELVKYMAGSIPMKLPQKPVPLNYGPVPSIGDKPGQELKIRYHGNYKMNYKFKNGVYERFMNGEKHTDRESGRQIAPKTVILQTANMKTIDAAGRQEISFIGSGPAMVFYGGRMLETTWKKSSASGMTDYFDRNGKKVVFDQTGAVWIQVVSPSLNVALNGAELEKDKKQNKAAEPAKSDKDKKAAEKS
ncbi:MAG: DUF3048 domain-containing protein [Candidatus Rifleibacteriota bacterium]